MKKSNMKVPALQQLYLQKNRYDHHQKKIKQIMTERKHYILRTNGDATQLKSIRKNLMNFEQRHNSRSLELAKKNNQFMKKLSNIQSDYKLKMPNSQSMTKISRMFSARSKIAEKQRQNYRIKTRVQSMSSQLSSKRLMSQYRKSLDIKNRLMHFKTETNNRIVLKVGKYLGIGSSKTIANCVFQDGEDQIVSRLPDVSQKQTDIHETNPSKMAIKFPKDAAFYKKQDIIKNKINLNNKLFKMARQRRLKTTLQKPTIFNSIEPSEDSKFFPTQQTTKF